MKNVCFLIVLMALVLTVSVGAIELTQIETRACQVAATGWVPLTVGKANTININYRASNTMQSVMVPWLRVQAGSSDSLGIVFSTDVYSWIVSKLSDWTYASVVVPDDHKAPAACAVVGTDITCDESAGKTPYLLSWDGVESYTDTGLVASNAGGKDVFDVSGQPAGNYSVTYSTDSFCSTPFLNLP